MSLPTRGRKEKICRFSLRNFFAIFKDRAVILRRMDKRSHAWPRGKLIFAVSFYIYFQLFRERLSEKLCTRQSRKVGSTDSNYNKHTNKTLKGGRAGSASRQDSSLFEEGLEEREL